MTEPTSSPPPEAPEAEEPPSPPPPAPAEAWEEEARRERERLRKQPFVVKHDADTQRSFVRFTCAHCGQSDERVLPDRPTTWSEILQGVREEIRECALLDAPHRSSWAGPPPFDLGAEQSLAAFALSGFSKGLRGLEILQRNHFFQIFYGYVWEFSREAKGRPDLEVMARRFEAHRLGRADHVRPILDHLSSPLVVSRCDARIVERVIRLAWQRDLMAQAENLAAQLRCDVGVDADDLRRRLDQFRTTLDQGVPNP